MENRPHAWFSGAKTRLSQSQLRAGQIAALCLIAFFCLAPVLAAQGLVALFLVSSASYLSIRLISSLTTMFWPPVRTEQKLADDELPVISLLCPLYREQESVNNLIRSLMAIDYPTNKLDVIILTEPDDPSTARAIDQHWPQLRVLINQRPGPKTKPHALNFGLSEAKGDIIGVYDAEDRPEAQQLRKVAQAFAERSNLGCVQARLNYYNADETILSQMFCLEYSLHFDYMLPGMAAMGLPLPLGGTSNFVRKDALLSVGGWDAHNVTEDADLGLRLAQRGYALSTIASTTLEEAPERCGPWIKQRSRWLKGYLQTWFVHTRNFSDWRGGLVLHATLGSVVLNALVTPWLLAAFVLSYITAWSWLDQIFAPALETPALALWVVGNFFHAWLLAMAPIRRGWFTPTTAIIILPFYSLLLSCAAYRAVYSFLFAPHYWAKTEHSPGEDITRGTARA